MLFTGHNGKTHDFNPALKADCGKAARRHHQPKGPSNPEPSPYRPGAR